jgi:hypothetical protein
LRAAGRARPGSRARSAERRRRADSACRTDPDAAARRTGIGAGQGERGVRLGVFAAVSGRLGAARAGVIAAVSCRRGTCFGWKRILAAVGG